QRDADCLEGALAVALNRYFVKPSVGETSFSSSVSRGTVVASRTRSRRRRGTSGICTGTTSGPARSTAACSRRASRSLTPSAASCSYSPADVTSLKRIGPAFAWTGMATPPGRYTRMSVGATTRGAAGGLDWRAPLGGRLVLSLGGLRAYADPIRCRLKFGHVEGRPCRSAPIAPA